MNVETDLEIVIQQKKAIISYSALPTIQGASVLIYQLFYNLINNALKFSRTDIVPHITITSHSSFQKNEEVTVIHVKDNGIGFGQEQAEKIFGTFARLHAKDKYEGTGLGLSLCRKVVERHHGSIRAEAEPGKGATFIIILPVRQQELQM